ncbi:MAG: endolytic transglycosylase MltG [Patescibacteria group bacterium]
MKTIFKLISVLFLLTLISAICIGVFIYFQLQPANALNQDKQRFIVTKGQSVAKTAQLLQEKGLVRNAWIFRLLVKQQNLAQKFQAGSFSLSPDMSPLEIAQELTKGMPDAIWITIPEGWRREEIAENISKLELNVFDKEEFLELTAGYEGMLFPDTYLVPREVTTQAVVNELLATFDKKITKELENDIAASDRDFQDVLVMASIIEREAQGYDQMRQVAGVLWKRIDIGMALQADATMQYAKGYNKVTQSWWTPPLAVDKEIDSPFNTYKNPGLPPRPICNPGAEAVKAALNPVKTDNLFYLHDSEGKIHFAKDLDGHNANVNKYLR